MRYHVIVRKGRKVIDTYKTDFYTDALDMLDTLLEKYQGVAEVEFKDTKPFG